MMRGRGRCSARRSLRRLPALAGVAAAAALGLCAIGCGDAGSPRAGPPRDGAYGGTLDCQQSPPFAEALGFGTGSALSTTGGERPGLALVDVADPSRTYQHPSWVRHGPLGPLARGADGTVYVAPTPGMDLSLSPPDARHVVLRVDAGSGEMAELLRLEPAQPPSPENPFGILGLTYDCATGSLYAATVAGSTRQRELGRIVRIDPDAAAARDSLPGIDAMGLGVFRGSRGRRLYFGAARRPEIGSVALDERGGFLGPPRVELTLPEWSDRARRIAFDDAGGMEVRAVPFAFNLAVGLDAPENVYAFRYDPAADAWLALER